MLKTLAGLNGISWMLTGCMLDSETLIPAYICCVNAAFLAIFYAANRERFDREVGR